jgi:thioredoxin-related protein
MEDNVFTDQAILADFDADFVPVKFNAETQDVIQFNGTSYGFDNSGKRGANKLALELGNVGGKIGYPTLVVLDASGKKLQTFPGFKDVQTLNELLNYFQSGSYQKMDFQQFQAGQ